MKIVRCLIRVVMMVCLALAFSAGAGWAKVAAGWTQDFGVEQCDCFATAGRNAYFILDPGYQLTLEESGKPNGVILTITVLSDSEKIGGIWTRVVEERETAGGQLTEISRNYYAYCTRNGSVFYFGENVDNYQGGKVVNHDGSWRAEGGSKAGLMMPGLPLLGSRYYEEISPGVSMDRAEIVSQTDLMETPAGQFEKVLKIEETTPLEPRAREYKYYAPGVGFLNDGDLKLVKYGFVK